MTQPASDGSEPTQEELAHIRLSTLNVEARTLPQTDEGSAQRVVVYFGDQLRYVKDTTDWRRWDGCRWALGTRADMMWIARRVARYVHNEVALFEDDTERQRHAAYARSCGSVSRMEAMIRVATGDEHLWADEADFDRDPLLLHFTNGTLDIRTGKLRPHAQEDLNTHLIPHPYDPSALAPTWENLVRRVVADADRLFEVDEHGKSLAGDDAYQFTQLVLGYATLGFNPEHQIFFFQGAERCGKSKMLELVRHTLGSDYGHPAQSDLVAKMRAGHHASETFSLLGKHVVTISETPTTFQLDENRVKSLTGDSDIPVYQLYSGVQRAARTTWTVALATNHLPNVQNWDGAVQERVVVIPCGPTLPPDERIQNIDHIISKNESAGVVRWLVDGARRWYMNATQEGKAEMTLDGQIKFGPGLPRPACVALAMSEFEVESDHLGAFLDDVIELTGNPKDRVPRNAIMERAKRWKARGEAVVIERNRLYSRVKQLPGVRMNTAREFTGVKMRPEGDMTAEQREWAEKMRRQE